MLSKEKLIELYVEKGMTMEEIADCEDVCASTVHNYIIKYNITPRKRMTEQTKRRISKAMKGKPSNRKGIPLSEETKRKLSERFKGVPVKECRAKKHRQDGYISVYCPNHPSLPKAGYKMEHILVMEEHIGRPLRKGEVVHHKNKIRNDNRIENLELMTFSEHAALHLKDRRDNKTYKHHVTPVVNITTGEEFNSCKEAAEAYSVPATHISRACREPNRTVKKCKWRYKEK